MLNYAKPAIGLSMREMNKSIVFFHGNAVPKDVAEHPSRWAVYNPTNLDPRFRRVGEDSEDYAGRLANTQ